jgi:hypothetical protein
MSRGDSVNKEEFERQLPAKGTEGLEEKNNSNGLLRSILKSHSSVTAQAIFFPPEVAMTKWTCPPELFDSTLVFCYLMCCVFVREVG